MQQSKDFHFKDKSILNCENAKICTNDSYIHQKTFGEKSNNGIQHWTLSVQKHQKFRFKGKVGVANICLFDSCNNIDTLFHVILGY